MKDLFFLPFLLLFLIALDRKNGGKPRFFYVYLTFLTLYLGAVVIYMIIN